jgi:hypothetical protein
MSYLSCLAPIIDFIFFFFLFFSSSASALVIKGMEVSTVALKSYHIKVNADMEYEMMFS